MTTILTSKEIAANQLAILQAEATIIDNQYALQKSNNAKQQATQQAIIDAPDVVS